MGRGNRLVLVKLLVTLAILAIVIGWFDWQAIIRQIAGYDRVFFLAAVAIFLLQVGCQVVRLRMLVAADGVTIGWWPLARLTLAGHAVNQIVPSIAGGDALRMLLIHRSGVPVVHAVRQIVIDRLAGLIALAAVAAAAWPFVPATLHETLPAGMVWTVAALATGGVASALMMRRLTVRRWRDSGPLERIGTLIDQLWHGVAHLVRQPVTLCWVLAISLVNQLLYVGGFWVIAIGMSLHLNLPVVAFLLPVATLVMMLPVSIAGWGVREAVLALGLGMVGIPGNAAVAASVLFGLSSTLVGILSLPLLAHVWNRRPMPALEAL